MKTKTNGSLKQAALLRLKTKHKTDKSQASSVFKAKRRGEDEK